MSGARWRTAVVTGASSGIGEAVARRLAAEGTGLVLVARDHDRLGSLAADLGPYHGIPVQVLAADLSTAPGRAVVEARLAEVDDPVDLLVNNAGFGTTGDLVDLDPEVEDQQVQVNVLAVLRLTRAALPGMVGRGRGAVVNVASLAGLYPTPGTATYGATKAFVCSLTDALHEELRGTGVTATAVLPGFTRTEFQDRAGWRPQAYLPDAVWMTADEVATAALDGAAAGRARVVPGVAYKVLNGVTSPLPAGARRHLLGLTRRLGL
ncbi:MAG: SDR family NAD(P)-dependent oxidoreductase [Actinomycetes bacterium]